MNQRPKTTTTPIGFVIRATKRPSTSSTPLKTSSLKISSLSPLLVVSSYCQESSQRARPPISGGFTPETSPSGPFTTKNIYSTSARTTKETNNNDQTTRFQRQSETLESTLETQRFQREQRTEGVRRVAMRLINRDSPSGTDTIRHFKSRHRSHSIGVDVTALSKSSPLLQQPPTPPSL